MATVICAKGFRLEAAGCHHNDSSSAFVDCGFRYLGTKQTGHSWVV